MRSILEGLTESESPSTAFQAVPLPMSFAHREDCFSPYSGFRIEKRSRT